MHEPSQTVLKLSFVYFVVCLVQDPNPPSVVSDHGAVHGAAHGPQASQTLPSINSNEPSSSSMVEEAMAVGACGPPVPYSLVGFISFQNSLCSINLKLMH